MKKRQYYWSWTAFGLVIMAIAIAVGVGAYIYFGWRGALVIVGIFAIVLMDGWVAGILPKSFRHAELKSRRAREGLCVHCGYDVRGNPAAKMCPECGKSAAGA